MSHEVKTSPAKVSGTAQVIKPDGTVIDFEFHGESVPDQNEETENGSNSSDNDS